MPWELDADAEAAKARRAMSDLTAEFSAKYDELFGGISRRLILVGDHVKRAHDHADKCGEIEKNLRALAKREGMNEAALLREALDDLLRKHNS